MNLNKGDIMLKHFLAVATLVTVFFTTSVNAATLGTTKGGANYQIGIILNKVLNKAGVNIVPLPHRSTQRYLERIHNEEVAFGIGNPANLTWGYHGTNASKKAHKNIRFVAEIQTFMVAIAVPADSKADSISDLKEGRTALAPKTSMFHYLFRDTLKNGGLTMGDQTPVPITSTGQMIKKFSNGQLDWAFSVIGAGFVKKWHLAHAASGGIKLITYDQITFKDSFGSDWVGYYLATVNPTKKWPEIKSPVKVLAYPYTVFAGKHVPDHVVERFVLGLHKHADDYRKASGMTRGFNEKLMFKGKGFGVPVHPGALKAYDKLKLR